MSSKKEEKDSFTEKFFNRIISLDKLLDDKIDKLLLRVVNISKYAFIAIMIMYLMVCLMSLGHKIFSLTLAQGALDMESIKMILTDGLFVLIVIAIVKTLFIKNGFDYAITFLEISFVVLVRKLILLETNPSETMLLLVLGFTSSIFFVLIVYINILKRKWESEKSQKKEIEDNIRLI